MQQAILVKSILELLKYTKGQDEQEAIELTQVCEYATVLLSDSKDTYRLKTAFITAMSDMNEPQIAVYSQDEWLGLLTIFCKIEIEIDKIKDMEIPF